MELYGPKGGLDLNCVSVSASAIATLRAEFSATVAAGGGHALDVHRGLHLQRVLAAAEADLRRRG